jgi:predicted site-specific integrase-resolvase
LWLFLYIFGILKQIKSKNILKLLQITRQTLYNYVKNGKVKVKLLPNGHYEYSDEDVYGLLNRDTPRINVIYARVSTTKQKKDLENQITSVKEYCSSKGIPITRIYQDVSSGMTFDRKDFQKLVEEVTSHKIHQVFITYPDRLSRISYQMFKELFEKFGVTIQVICETNDPKTIEKEVFQEIISLMHCFAMKIYSQRRKERLTLIKKQLELEIRDVD